MNVDFTSNKEQVLKAVDEAIKRGLEICGGKAESYAKKLCPTDTSRLKNSIRHTLADDRTEIIGTNVKYAPFVELGHHQEPGRYVPAIGKRLVNSFVPPKPFLRPAAEDHSDEYKEILQTELSKIK